MLRSLVCLAFVFSSGFLAAKELPKLKVSENGRYLQYEDGSPFFYLGDTAWELFHRLNREDVDRYLEDRASKGFNVIQAVALAEINGLNDPNAYGHKPLINEDPTKPDVKDGPENDYWDHVDYCVKKANSLGMYIGLLPTWGDKWNLKWAANSKFNPEIFTPANAEQYGQWIGSRYQDTGVIWILGGDRPIENDTHRAIMTAMAEGIRKVDNGAHLMTFHPSGSSSSTNHVRDAKWLDFHMMQSGHARPDIPNYQRITDDIRIAPKKPTIDGEPCYEDHPLRGREHWERRLEPGFTLKWFDEYDVRVAGYRAVLAGAGGHTYGNHNIWQMWAPPREPVTVARTRWDDALEHPGAKQMGTMKEFFLARPYWKMTRDDSLISKPTDNVEEKPLAAISQEGDFLVAFLPVGGTLNVATGKLKAEKLRGWWFNPRQNTSQLIGTFSKKENTEFTSLAQGRNNDWVLVVEDATKEYPRIGTTYNQYEPKTK